MAETPIEPKVKWEDRKKEYFKNYFQEKVKKNKDVVIEKKNIDWNNIEEKRKYYLDYYHKNRQKYIKEQRTCEYCMCLITDRYHHNKTKKHQQAVMIHERLKNN